MHDLFAHHKIFKKSRPTETSLQTVCIVDALAKICCFLCSGIVNCIVSKLRCLGIIPADLVLKGAFIVGMYQLL